LQTLPLPGGNYSLRIDYDATPSGDPELAGVAVRDLDGKPLLSGKLDAAASPFESQFMVPGHNASGRVRVLIFFEGFGALEVRRLTIRRLK
jgi:hypothetical protein